jgi:hypothetical protein
MNGGAQPRQVVKIVNWCDHSQEFVAWPEAGGYWFGSTAAGIKELELAPAGARYTAGVQPRAWRNPNGSTTPRIDRALTDAGRTHL